jgi:hypothetical protein
MNKSLFWNKFMLPGQHYARTYFILPHYCRPRRYSVTVAASFLELLLQERSSILEKTKKRIKKDLAQAIEALKKIPSRTALQELDDMLTGGGGIEWGSSSNTIDTVSRAEALQKTKITLKEIEEDMIEKYVSFFLCLFRLLFHSSPSHFVLFVPSSISYKDCYEHCTRVTLGASIQGNVIPEGRLQQLAVLLS